jgi:hypothetical protein
VFTPFVAAADAESFAGGAAGAKPIDRFDQKIDGADG